EEIRIRYQSLDKGQCEGYIAQATEVVGRILSKAVDNYKESERAAVISEVERSTLVHEFGRLIDVKSREWRKSLWVGVLASVIGTVLFGLILYAADILKPTQPFHSNPPKQESH